MPLTEALILQIHRDMLKHSDKGQRQSGAYKFGPNRVEAKDQSGNVVGVVFDPTPPHLAPKEMQELVEWHKWADEESFMVKAWLAWSICPAAFKRLILS